MRLELVLCLICVTSLWFVSTVNSLAFGFGNAPLTELITEDEPVREGNTPPDVIIERVISLPGDGENDTDLVVLRNIGGQTADLTDWKLTDRNTNSDDAYVFGGESCGDQAMLPPSAKIELRPRTEENPCGFDFTINFRDEINVLNPDDDVVSSVSWSESEVGTSIRILADGTYDQVPENLDVIETLEELGNYTVLLTVLEHLNLTDELKARTDPRYTGVEIVQPEKPVVDPQFPAHFGFALNRSELSPSPTPSPSPEPPQEGIPRRGPYTIFAPNDEAFDDFRAQIAGPGNDPVSEEFMLELPELEDIVLYHVIGGAWTSEYLLNNTPIYTAKGVEVVPFTDGLMNEGLIRLHDACIDKPTPDPFDCIEQVEFNKCNDPFMTNPLGAQWQGGYCERTCGRCTCDPRGGAPCADITLIDVMASNGVIHSVTRILFPPPVFEKEILAPSAELALGTATATTGLTSRTSTTGSATATTETERPVLGIGFTVRDEEGEEDDDNNDDEEEEEEDTNNDDEEEEEDDDNNDDESDDDDEATTTTRTPRRAGRQRSGR